MASEHDGPDEVDLFSNDGGPVYEVEQLIDEDMIWSCPLENGDVQVFLSEKHTMTFSRSAAEAMCSTLARFLGWGDAVRPVNSVNETTPTS